MRAVRRVEIPRNLDGLDERLRWAEIQVGLMVPGTQDVWHEIDTPDEPGFQSGWANYGSGLTTAAFYIDNDGWVQLKGVIRNPSPSAGSTAFTLPAGYRPDYHLIMPAVRSSGGFEFVGKSALTILTDGSVQLGAATVIQWLSLDNHRFKGGN